MDVCALNRKFSVTGILLENPVSYLTTPPRKAVLSIKKRLRFHGQFLCGNVYFLMWDFGIAVAVAEGMCVLLLPAVGLGVRVAVRAAAGRCADPAPAHTPGLLHCKQLADTYGGPCSSSRACLQPSFAHASPLPRRG